MKCCKCNTWHLLSFSSSVSPLWSDELAWSGGGQRSARRTLLPNKDKRVFSSTYRRCLMLLVRVEIKASDSSALTVSAQAQTIKAEHGRWWTLLCSLHITNHPALHQWYIYTTIPSEIKAAFFCCSVFFILCCCCFLDRLKSAVAT